MALTLRNDVSINATLKTLNRTQRSLSRNFERISSGFRITRAADDAAGLAVAENLRAAHTSADVAARNINDGISLIGVAEGASSEVSNILVRLRELAVQSASGTLATAERGYINDEAAELTSEIDRIANVTEFNGVQLTNGSLTNLDVQVGIGAGANNQISINLGNLTTANIGLTGINLNSTTGALAALGNLDSAIESVSDFRSSYGATENRLGFALNNIETFSEATKAAESTIRDADFGIETAVLAQNQILQQAGIAILAQANLFRSDILQLIQS